MGPVQSTGSFKPEEHPGIYRFLPQKDESHSRKSQPFKVERGEVAINHLDGMRDITVEADLANPKASPTEIMQDLTARIPGLLEANNLDVNVGTEGQNREVDRIIDSATSVLPAILFLIYVTIVFAFRSYSQPLILLAIVPFCLIGVAWGHWLHGFPMSILSYLGIIGLIGIVVNDGLVFNGRFNNFLKEGLSFDEALYETGRARFRAIFLTSITTIAGLAPLMLEKKSSSPVSYSNGHFNILWKCHSHLVNTISSTHFLVFFKSGESLYKIYGHREKTYS